MACLKSLHASMKSKSKGRTNQSKDLSPDLKIQLFRFYREFNLHLGQFSNQILYILCKF